MSNSRNTTLRWEWIAIAIVLIGSVLLRIAYLSEFLADRAMLMPVVDAVFHDYWARALVTGNWTPAPGFNNPMIPLYPFAKPPGYTYFMAAVYALSNGKVLAVMIAQMALGLLNIVITWRLGRWAAGRAAGLIAAAIMGFYWVVIFFEGELLDPTLTIALTLLLALAVKHWLTRPRPPTALLIGLLIGVVSLVRSNYLPIAILTAIGMLIAIRGKKTFIHAALVIAGCALAVAPVTIRNWRAGGEFVLITANSGINLYIGNNPRVDLESPNIPEVAELLHKRGWSHFDDYEIVRALERKLGREVGYSGASKYFARQAITFIRDNPGQAAWLTFQRGVRMLGPVEYSNDVIELDRKASPVLSRLPGNFTIIFVLAVFGAAQWAFAPRTANKRRFAVWIVVTLGLLYASYIICFLEARYRTPMIPFMAIGAGFCIDSWARMIARRGWLPLASGVIGCALLYIALWWPTSNFKPDEAYWRQVRATQYSAVGDAQRCREELEKAYAIDPNRALIALRLGQAYVQQNRFDDALKLFERAVQIHPDNFEANLYLGYTLLETDKPRDAEQAFLRAIRIDPANETVRDGLATAMRLRGATPEEISRAFSGAGAR